MIIIKFSRHSAIGLQNGLTTYIIFDIAYLIMNFKPNRHKSMIFKKKKMGGLVTKSPLAPLTLITISFIFSTRHSRCTKMFIANSWLITAIKFWVKTKWSWTIVWSTENTILTLIMRITISFIFKTNFTMTEFNFTIIYSGTVD